MKVGDCMLRGIILVGVLLAISGEPALADSGGFGGYGAFNPPVPITPSAAQTYYGKYGHSLTKSQISRGAFAGGLKQTADVGPVDRAGGGSSHTGAWELAIVGVVALLGLAGAATLSRPTVLARRARAG